MKLSQSAFDLIVSFEVGGKSSYEKNWRRPIWPGGASGVTIGIGYDLGYATRAKFLADWSTQLCPAIAKSLATVVGLRGIEAKQAAQSLRAVVVPWAAALWVFQYRSLPAYAAATARAFPESANLPPDSFGALVSLVYNRGASMLGDRRREMRAVRSAILSGKPELAPGLIRAMKRIWVGTSIERGMARRREAEARLFELGLGAISPHPHSP